MGKEEGVVSTTDPEIPLPTIFHVQIVKLLSIVAIFFRKKLWARFDSYIFNVF